MHNGYVLLKCQSDRVEGVSKNYSKENTREIYWSGRARGFRSGRFADKFFSLQLYNNVDRHMCVGLKVFCGFEDFKYAR